MSVFSGPNVAMDGLILHLDPANPDCFGTGETSATNLVSGGAVTGASGQPNAGAHTADTANFPAYNSINGGIFDFAGGKGMNCDEDLGTHTTITFDIWYYKNGSGQHYITDGRNDGGQWFLSNYTSDNINFTDVATYNFDTTYNAANTDFIDRWQHMIFTSDGTGSKLYIDGTERTLVLSGSVTENLGVNYRIGTRYTTSSEWTGYMGPIKIYNRVITAAEAWTNFLAIRERYGI